MPTQNLLIVVPPSKVLVISGHSRQTAEGDTLAHARPLVRNDAAQAVLNAEPQAGWWKLIGQEAPCLPGLETQRSLVHADANPENVLVERRESGWLVSSVLDWEFALSGTPFAAGFLRGWGDPFPGAVRQARALDVHPLLDFVNRPSALQAQILALIQRQVQTASL